jgi:hypothetical protein
MPIIPTVRCRNIRRPVAFYVLDFQRVGGDDDFADPSVAVLSGEGAYLFLPSHDGDGMFGQAIVVATDDVDALGNDVHSSRAGGVHGPRALRARLHPHMSNAGRNRPRNDNLGDLGRRADVRERFVAMGAEPGGGTPKEFSAFIVAEVAKRRKVVENAKIRLD